MFFPKIVFFHPLGEEMAKDVISWRFEDSLSESSRFEVKLQGRSKWQSSLFELGLGDRFKCQIYFGESWEGTSPIPGYATETPTYTIDNFEMDFGTDSVILTAKAIPNIASLTTLRSAVYSSPENALLAIAFRAGMFVRGERPTYREVIDQKKETDLEVLERLAEEYDLVLKIEDRNISLIPYSSLESYDSVFSLDTEEIDRDGTFFNIRDYKIYKGVVLSWEIDVEPGNWTVPVSSSGNANLFASVNVNTSVNIPSINLGGSASVTQKTATGTISGTTSDGKTVTGTCFVTVPGQSLSLNVSGSANGSGSGSGSGSASGNIAASGIASVPREPKKQELRLSVSDERVAGGSRWFKYTLTELPPNNTVARTKGLLLIQRKNRERLTGTIKMSQGDARCRSGLPIKLRGGGWGWPLDASGGTGDRYLIESTEHTFDLNSGWQTQIKVFKCYNQLSR
jgi:hypothetical protein